MRGITYFIPTNIAGDRDGIEVKSSISLVHNLVDGEMGKKMGRGEWAV